MAFGGVRGHEESPLIIVCRYDPEGRLGGLPVSLCTDWMDEKKKRQALVVVELLWPINALSSSSTFS